MKKNLSTADFKKIQNKGLSEKDIEKQLDNFIHGFPELKLVKPARLNDGIIPLKSEDIENYQHIYHKIIGKKKAMKFIPASGAASRMFKFLFEYLENPLAGSEQVELFINRIKEFAFYNDLKSLLNSKGEDIEELIQNRQYQKIIYFLLSKEGLNYGNLPKALINFHKDVEKSRTPIEEHIVESADYCMNENRKAYLHFTISPQHEAPFNTHLLSIKNKYEEELNAEFEITYSFQKEHTDVIAVKPNNDILRDENGNPVFRPGGHGALLENLNDVEADVVFIKNIDNVVVDNLKQEGNRYKKALAGLMLSYQEKIFGYLEKLDREDKIEKTELDEMHRFVKEQLNVIPPGDLTTEDKQCNIDYLRTKLNRPLRICGMVENKGEPGGGPFWVKDKDNSISLQIVEKAQINTGDPKQKKVLEESTHFNPVDLVCGLKNYKGKSFDLLEYRDPSAGIITNKSKGGVELKAQELPGLWNGGMAYWNTVFVEVPLSTFTPVKTVNDLLREEHQ
jgi:hypothetical protein